MLKDAPQLTLLETQLAPNGIGGFKPTDVIINSFNGWIDLLGKDDSMKNNANLQDSTHVCITDYDTYFKKGMKVNGGNSTYLITLVDDPVNMHKHLEVYLKYEGAANV